MVVKKFEKSARNDIENMSWENVVHGQAWMNIEIVPNEDIASTIRAIIILVRGVQREHITRWRDMIKLVKYVVGNKLT